MAAIPYYCPAFNPVYYQGEYYCLHCGLISYYHQAHHGVAFQPNERNQVQLQQQHDLPVGQFDVVPPPANLPPINVTRNNKTISNTATRTNYHLSDEHTYTGLTEHQLWWMLAMARRLRWDIRGCYRDPEILQFCADIGIGWVQFSNWVNRNRRRVIRNRRS